MIIRLSEVADIQAGHPFRGSIKHDENGTVSVVQAKDISDLGELLPNGLVKTETTGNKNPNWLQEGDILFIAKGLRNYACYISHDLEKTICAPSLFLIRVKRGARDHIDPLFLAWQLNQKPVQNYFRKSAEGSMQINIRKPVLADVELGIPSMREQHAIAKLYAASLKEHALLNKLINNRKQQLNAIAYGLISTDKN